MGKEYFGDVIAVYPNKIRIAIDKEKYDGMDDEQLKKFTLGAYLEISDKEDAKILSIIENFSITCETDKDGKEKKKYIIEALPLGSIVDGKFKRGGDSIVLPPKGMSPASEVDIKNVYEGWIEKDKKFKFSKLIQNDNVQVSVDGNRFFNKHFAIIGATGSGKSCSVAKILQEAIKTKNAGYQELNNSHIILFDIHGEYKTAFPECNYLELQNLKIPYWLFDSEELGELFIESNEQNSHNQISQFRFCVTENKKLKNQDIPSSKVFYDSSLKFSIEEVVRYIKNVNNELINKNKNRTPADKNGILINNRIPDYFNREFEFSKIDSGYVNGPYTGDFERFVMRLETTINNPRLNFIFKDIDSVTIEDVLRKFIGYLDDKKSNITVIDLGGIPFEVLSITVSLISRLLFDFGFYYKKYLSKKGIICETPLLLVYEEAHKYVPRSELVRYRASKNAIERIAKEGRKYGVTLGIVSQRPSEISETIFSQCNNFIAMRLTNPNDQAYVKRLLPDNIGGLIDVLPSLQQGEGLLIGDAIVMPTLIKIDKCNKEPSSSDIPYYDIWKEQWKDVLFEKITENWQGKSKDNKEHNT